MQIVTSLLGLLALTQAITASPFTTTTRALNLAPVPVTNLQCDGNTYQCTAKLAFGDGRWVGQWSVAVFHDSLNNNQSAMKAMSMAPVGVNELNCDGNTYKCTANLDFGDGKWVAQWSAKVYHKSSAKLLKQEHGASTLAPVPAYDLTCDGNTYKCDAALDFGDGRWVAEWDANVKHT